MIAVDGIYKNGVVRLVRKIRTRENARVIVTFPDEELQNETKRLTLKDFLFQKSRKDSERFRGSLSDVVIEDRRAEQ
jgi:hypothetical protein